MSDRSSDEELLRLTACSPRHHRSHIAEHIISDFPGTCNSETIVGETGHTGFSKMLIVHLKSVGFDCRRSKSQEKPYY